MARTAVVNPRNRAGRFTKKRRRNPSRRRSRRRNYGAAALVNPPRRRRRRRSYGGAVVHRRRRRRNPASPYASGGYYRRPNPSVIDFHDLGEILPAATAGVMAARFALKQSGEWSMDNNERVPGWKQAVAIWIAAQLGGQIVSQMFGSEAKGNAAKIAALGMGGDLFLTKRFMRDSEWVQNNLSLAGGMGDDETTQYVQDEDGNVYALNGFQTSSPLGDWTDATGNTWAPGPSGWQLAQLSGSSSGSRLAGFQTSSPLGAAPSSQSSFGYARTR